MEATFGIEFFHSSSVDDLEKKINDFLKQNLQKILVVKRNLFFHDNEYKLSLFYKNENPNLINSGLVKFFKYNDRDIENESKTEEDIKNFISSKNKISDVLFYTYVPERSSFENRPLIVRTYRNISEYNLVAVFYQD